MTFTVIANERPFVVDGLGAVGMRVARELAATPDIPPVLLRSQHTERIAVAVDSLGDRVRRWADEDDRPDATVVIAREAAAHVPLARRHLEAGRNVVSCADDPDVVRQLLDLEDVACASESTLVVGAAFSPGLSCLLARHAANALSSVTSVRIAMVGAGGARCVARRAEAVGGVAPVWRDGAWDTPSPGTELVWFPDPVQALDVGPGALAEPLLVHRGLPDVPTITAFVGQPDRSLAGRGAVARLLRRSHPEPVGAVRVEVVGERDGEEAMVVYAAVDRPAVAAAAVAAVTALNTGELAAGVTSLAEVSDPVPLLRELARRGVKAATFEPAT